MRKLIWIGLLALLPVVGCQKEVETSGAMSDQEVVVTVETQTVETSSFKRTRAYVGNISASKQVKVIPLASERILKFPWENGDFVEQGAIIAEIRNEVSKKGVDAMNAQIKSVDAQLKAAERELKRVRSMYESNIVSRQQYDQAQDGVTTLLATKQQLLATQEQQKMGLDYARVVAPISGIISAKNSEVGDIASSAMPLCILNDMETLKVTLNVNEGDTPYLALGQDVSIRFDAFPNEVVHAKITRIMPYVNTTTRTNTVEAEFPNVKIERNGLYKYKPGMYARVSIDLETTENAVVIPPKAMLLVPELLSEQVNGQQLRRVFVLKDDGTVQAKKIEVGEYNGDIVEVKSGLERGEKLVVRGHHSLRDGDKVKVVAGDAAKDAVATKPAKADDAKADVARADAAKADGAVDAKDDAKAGGAVAAKADDAKAPAEAAQDKPAVVEGT